MHCAQRARFDLPGLWLPLASLWKWYPVTSYSDEFARSTETNNVFNRICGYRGMKEGEAGRLVWRDFWAFQNLGRYCYSSVLCRARAPLLYQCKRARIKIQHHASSLSQNNSKTMLMTSAAGQKVKKCEACNSTAWRTKICMGTVPLVFQPSLLYLGVIHTTSSTELALKKFGIGLAVFHILIELGTIGSLADRGWLPLGLICRSWGISFENSLTRTKIGEI